MVLRNVRGRGRNSSRRQGQGLVEFALVLPVILLLLLIAVDFGRALYGWVVLQNSARIAANYAGLYPDGWKGSGDPTIQSEYERLIENDLNTANCVAPSTPPAPVFTDGPDTADIAGIPDTAYDIGDTVVVSLTCGFTPVTPMFRDIVGPSLALGARSEFRIRAGDIVGFANATRIPAPGPTPIPTPTPACATVSITATNDSNPGNPHRWDFAGSVSPASAGWSWTWSGAFNATVQTVNNHNFSSAGIYSVTLTAAKGSCSVSATQQVVVP